jgi:hypothetical protein
VGVNVSSSLKKLIGNVTLKKGLFPGLSVWLILATHVSAQQSAVEYIEYPQILGKVQPLHLSGVPKWATFDAELRGRTESQTSNSYISGNEQLYELTRIYGGMEVRPTRYLTGYIQFIDTHALGLPLSGTPPPICGTPSMTGRHTSISTSTSTRLSRGARS